MGYTINNQPIYRLKRYNTIIGIYGVTYDQKSHYVCKVSISSDGFFIRATKWTNKILEVAKQDEDLYIDLRKQIKD